jgi:hypothetical protein
MPGPAGGWRAWLMAAALVLLSGLAQAAARVTIVDGEATLVEGERGVLAAEGLELAAETLVRTGPRSTLVRLEWPDGTAADLGPDTHAMVEPGGFAARGGRAPALYLLRGWVKLSAGAKASTPGLLTPRVDVQPFKGALVVMAVGGEHWLFAESGDAAFAERDAKPASNLSLRNGEVYVRDGAAKGSVAPRPTPAQMQRVPRGFRDTLPLRLAALQGRKVEARPATAPTYADLREWLVAEKPLRRNFTRRFATQARNPAFRAGLVENLIQHPEWEPVLFPERFTKPASAPR